MQVQNKTVWRSIAISGALIMLLAFILSIFQYFAYKQYDQFFLVRYASLVINTELFACFVYMIFNPLDFIAYAIAFYIYAVGNLIDSGNILAMLFLVIAGLFFYITFFFTKHRVLKLVLLSVPLIAALGFQCYRLGAMNFCISLMHIVATVFIVVMIVTLLRPEIQKFREMKEVFYLDKSECTEQEVEWLNKVLSGSLYSSIAEESKVSESTVKIRMLKLYKMLDAKNKTEFCAMYRNSRIELR